MKKDIQKKYTAPSTVVIIPMGERLLYTTSIDEEGEGGPTAKERTRFADELPADVEPDDGADLWSSLWN